MVRCLSVFGPMSVVNEVEINGVFGDAHALGL